MFTIRKAKTVAIALALASLLSAAGAGEVARPAGYPTGPVHWISPVPAGSSVDIACRGLANFVDPGASIVIENIAGGSQTIGIGEAANRPADGQTWITFGNAGAFTQPVMNDLTYEVADFRHIAMIAPEVQACFAVRADSPIKTTRDVLDRFAGDDRFVIGTANVGSFSFLAMATSLQQLGLYGRPNAVLVNYNGAPENITALLSGETDIGILDSSDAYVREQSGELRVITILHDQKCAYFPEVDLISNHGVKDLATLVGLKWVAVRKDTPPEIVEWIKQEVNKGVADPRYQEYLVTMGFGTMRTYSEEEMTKIVEDGCRDYAAIMKACGLID